MKKISKALCFILIMCLFASLPLTAYADETPAAADASAQEATGDLKEYSDYAGKYIVVDADMAKTGIDISAYITNERNTILVWSGATKKRAASAVQTIKLAARQSLADQTLKASNGKLKLDKKYEVYNADKDKWGALPKIDDSCELLIRLKATAKGGKETDSSYAASEPATLVITFGEYDRKKGESGITSAQIVAQLQ